MQGFQNSSEQDEGGLEAYRGTDELTGAFNEGFIQGVEQFILSAKEDADQKVKDKQLSYSMYFKLLSILNTAALANGVKSKIQDSDIQKAIKRMIGVDNVLS